jgi:hypothetical protein
LDKFVESVVVQNIISLRGGLGNLVPSFQYAEDWFECSRGEGWRPPSRGVVDLLLFVVDEQSQAKYQYLVWKAADSMPL